MNSRPILAAAHWTQLPQRSNHCQVQVLISLNFVFDASLVPETCPNGFIDTRELNKQASEESRYRTSNEVMLHMYDSRLSGSDSISFEGIRILVPPVSRRVLLYCKQPEVAAKQNSRAIRLARAL
jgi:hypothetical protein